MGVSIPDALILALVGMGLFGIHWVPWWIFPGLTDERQELHRPFAYALGCGWILLGALVHALARGRRGVDLGFLALDFFAAGIGTVLPRVLKMIAELRIQCKNAQLWEEKATDGQTKCGSGKAD